MDEWFSHFVILSMLKKNVPSKYKLCLYGGDFIVRSFMSPNIRPSSKLGFCQDEHLCSGFRMMAGFAPVGPPGKQIEILRAAGFDIGDVIISIRVNCQNQGFAEVRQRFQTSHLLYDLPMRFSVLRNGVRCEIISVVENGGSPGLLETDTLLDVTIPVYESNWPEAMREFPANTLCTLTAFRCNKRALLNQKEPHSGWATFVKN